MRPICIVGVFGSHVACVLRRLRRLCEIYGARPQFICCSATIANPGEHAAKLVGLPFTVVDNDGSPHGGKDFVFWNPPLLDERKKSAAALTANLLFSLPNSFSRKFVLSLSPVPAA